VSIKDEPKQKLEEKSFQSPFSDYSIFIIGLVLILLSSFSNLNASTESESIDVVNQEINLSQTNINTLHIISKSNR